MPRILLLTLTLCMTMLAWSNTAAACPICKTNGNAVVFKLNQSEWGIYYQDLYEKINVSKSNEKAKSMVIRNIWVWDEAKCELKKTGGRRHLTFQLGKTWEINKTNEDVVIVSTKLHLGNATRGNESNVRVLGNARRTIIVDLLRTLKKACKQAGR